ncbi:MAG TPA: ABC transporter ATP-binding protein, partial [Candidatus Poseidoniales archaeon]
MAERNEPMVSAVDMAKKYGDFIALHPLNVEVHAGEFFGVFGPNGAGKSTFIKLLTGQLRPSKGRIEVLGVDAVNDPQKVKANIGIVPESESPPSFLTPTEFLEFVARLRGVDDMKAKVEHWLDWFGLEEKRDTMCKDLSKGQRQKVMLASAFIHKPK